jgi:Ca2+-binding RTX toxin-like protein
MPHGDEDPPLTGVGEIKLSLATITNDTVQFFSNYHKISFENIDIPLFFEHDFNSTRIAIATAAGQDWEFTADRISADIYYLTKGDDSFGLFEGVQGHEVYGGPGNDQLTGSIYNAGVRLDGGTGNDVLWAVSASRDHLIGGEGNDTLHISPALSGYEVGEGDKVSLGAGSDTLVFGNFYGGSTFVGDFQASGPVQDKLDLRSAMAEAGFEFETVEDAVDAGALGITLRKGYTYLSVDTDGDAVPDHQFAHMKGVFGGTGFYDDFLI